MILRVYFRVVKNAMVIVIRNFLRQVTDVPFMERPVRRRVADAVARVPSVASVAHVLSVALNVTNVASAQHVPSVAPNVHKRPKLARR